MCEQMYKEFALENVEVKREENNCVAIASSMMLGAKSQHSGPFSVV